MPAADPARRIRPPRPALRLSYPFQENLRRCLLRAALLALARPRDQAFSSRDLLSSLRHAQPAFLVALGFLLNILAFGVRAFRFNLLLLPADRIPFATAWSLSGATTFLLQVMPFRSGEIGVLGFDPSRPSARAGRAPPRSSRS